MSVHPPVPLRVKRLARLAGIEHHHPRWLCAGFPAARADPYLRGSVVCTGDPDFDQQQQQGARTSKAPPVRGALKCASRSQEQLPAELLWDRRNAPRATLVNNCTCESCPERLIGGLFSGFRVLGFGGIFWVGRDTAAPARVVLKTNTGLGGSRMGRSFLILVSLYFGDLYLNQYKPLFHFPFNMMS